jgi:hypothetical protein
MKKMKETKDQYGMRHSVSVQDDGVKLADLVKAEGHTPKNAKEGTGIRRSTHVDGTSIVDAEAHGISRTAKGSSDAEQPVDGFMQK